MKILITGGSGYLAKLLTENINDHDFVIWSRNVSNINTGSAFQSSSLEDFNWWDNIEIPDDLDVVIHLAEIVKEKCSEEQIKSVILSHTSFLKKSCNKAKLVIYPDTAYKYDSNISRSSESYVYIKRAVINNMTSYKNFYHPVVHPVFDGRGALAKLAKLTKIVALVNIFYNFSSRIPYSTEPYLIETFKSIFSGHALPNTDLFVQSVEIQDLFHDRYKYNSFILSLILKFILKKLIYHPSVNLLLNGREINN